MYNLTYIFKGEVKKLTIKVTDYLNNEYTITRSGVIDNRYYTCPKTFTICNPEYETIRYWALKEGISVGDNTSVQVAKIELLKTQLIDIKREMVCIYRWFRPNLRAGDGVSCEEVRTWVK